MLKTTVTGADKFIRGKIREAARWMLSDILPDCDVNVRIKLVNKLYEKEKCDGWCSWIYTNHMPRNYQMEIDNTTLRKMYFTLSHECIHIKQFTTGILKDVFKTNGEPLGVRWYSKVVDDNEVKYKKQPWEIAARKHGRILYHRYMVHLRTGE